MKIFLKYVVKCMTEKKGRLILLIIAIAMSTGLLVTSSGVVDIAIDSFTKPMLESFEGKDIQIVNKEGDEFFDDKDLVKEGITDLSKEIIVSGQITEDEITYITVHGREDKSIKNDKIIEGNISDFSGAKCIISQRTSEDMKLKVGDTLEFNMAGETRTLKIMGINMNETVFYSDKKNSFSVIIPYEYLSKDLKMEGKYNFITANKTSDFIDDSINTFNNNNSKFKAAKLFDEDSIKSQTKSITGVLYVMLLIVVFMSAIIIYGSFKLTITERLPVIGTFLSQGATKKTIERILFIESVGYGIVGAIFGNGLGIGGLYLINYLLSPLKDYGIVEKVSINPIFIILGTIFAILLSLISAIIPVKRIRKLQVKEVILNNVNVSMSISWKKFIIGTILIIISIIINFIEEDWSDQVSGIMVIVSIVGLIMIYPKIIDLVTNVFYKIFRGRSKVIVFSLNNLRTSKVLLGNITLIVISLLSIMLITSLGTSIKEAVTEAYTELNADIIISDISPTRTSDESTADKIIKELKENKNINEETIDYSLTTFGTIGEVGFVVEGINPDKYKKFNGYLELNASKYESFYNEFSESSDNQVIITTAVQKAINKEKGEKIILKINNIEKEFVIVGVIEGKLFNSGRVIFTKYDVLEREFKINSPDSITFSTKIDAAEVNDEIKTMLKSLGATSITKAEMEKDNAEGNQQIIDILSIFSYLAIIIAALGVLNNIIIGFIQRKRDLAVLSSVGMARMNRGLMLLVESVLSVVWSLIIAIPYSYLGLSLVSKFVKEYMPLEIKLDLSYIPVYFMASLIVILLATIPVLLKSRKLSIIEELKYE